MASNLNKAFMRAYAKDRPAQTDESAIQTASNPPAAPAQPAPSSAPSIAPANVTASRVSQPVAGPRVMPVAEPVMEPSVFAARYAAPTAAQSPAPVATPKPTVQAQSPQARSPQVHSPQVHSPQVHSAQVRSPQVQSPQVRSPQAHNTQAQVPQAQVSHVQAPAPIAQPRVINASTNRQPVAQPVPQQVTASEDPSRVWQRIDAAHGAQANHPTPTQSRPTVAVNAARTPAPKRMHAAAPAPAAPVAPPAARIDAPSAPARHLPLVGDEATMTSPQEADARRRTVADFLYAAGQYNPGRILASAEPAEIGTAPAVSASMRTTEMVRPAAEHYDPVSDVYATTNTQQINRAGVSNHVLTPTPIDQPLPQETVPRRMGQILRVDVPRGQATASAMPADTAQPTPAQPISNQPRQMPAQQPMPQQTVPQHAVPQQPGQQVMPQALQPTVQPVMQPTFQQPVVAQSATPVLGSQATVTAATMPSQSPESSSTLAPVAKYVLEQRRIDRAHKLNEAEAKLRRNTHKIFNPVWEVDNLQWPGVVEKLMQQRAQSMAHVAEHLKTACQDGLSVLGVTSAEHGEGRTTVACCLARLAAAHGLNVALVDIDLDHPTLCVQTNMEVEHDWRDCLSEDITLEEVAVHSIEDQLTVLPLKPRGGRPGLLASDSRIADILSDLTECFELVIVDCAKTNSSGNIITGLANTKIFDAAIVVVDRRDTQAERIEDAVRMIQQTGIESIGIVDNFSM